MSSILFFQAPLLTTNPHWLIILFIKDPILSLSPINPKPYAAEAMAADFLTKHKPEGYQEVPASVVPTRVLGLPGFRDALGDKGFGF